ncbi:DUF3999 family protein [Winogradskyella sp. PAMC22761]|nr:DUF3999 family protein [Winogradskyella sp. PAMC22761]
MTLKTRLFLGFLIACVSFCSAQMTTYNYKRALENVGNEWHKITLPDAVFSKVNSDLSDIRIYGTTVNNDTIEAPYLLKIRSEKVIKKTIPFHLINKSKGNDGYYFTFQLNSKKAINQIDLNFNNQNFDWKVALQGSQNQNEWFTILEDYRILSIKNETTDYKFTKLVFPDAKYRFYRLIVKGAEQPKFESAQLFKHEISGGSYINHQIKSIKNEVVKPSKTTEIELELEQLVSLSNLNINVNNTFDYYRPIKIEYRNDSLKTEKGWKYYYKTITNGTLNSLEANSFNFDNTIAKHIRLSIYNGDNQPLSFGEMTLKGYEYQLITRFTEPADYMLVYGNTSARHPNYDIAKFETKVPEGLEALKIGEEQIIEKQEQAKVEPLLDNKYWLWAIIGVVILVLSGFTLKMLKKR